MKIKDKYGKSISIENTEDLQFVLSAIMDGVAEENRVNFKYEIEWESGPTTTSSIKQSFENG